MKTSFDIPDDVWKRAKHYTIDTGKDLKDIIADALRMYLDRVEKHKNAKSGKGEGKEV